MKSLVDVRSERLVLGAMQLYPTFALEMTAGLSAESFGEPSHGPMFDALRECVERHGEVDYTRLARILADRRRLNVVGGIQGVNDMTDASGRLAGDMPTPFEAEAAARRVAELALRRAVVERAQRAITKACDADEPIDVVIDFAQQTMQGVAASDAQHGRSIGAAMVELFDGRARTSGIGLPWPALSAAIGGLRKKRLIVIAGRPGTGKSAFANNLALALAAPAAWWPEAPHLPAPVPVIFFALEMSDVENAARAVAAVVRRISGQEIENGNTEGREAEMSAASRSLDRAPLHYDEHTRSVARMRSVARSFFALHGPGVIVVDYLQLAKATGLDVEKNANRERHVSAMTAELKAIAKDLDVPVVLLAQLNRAGASEDEAPRLENLRESGAVEQDADVVIFLWGKRPAPGDATQVVHVTVAKARGSSAGGDYPMVFHRRETRFEEAEGAEMSLPLEAPDLPEDESYNVGGYRRQADVAKVYDLDDQRRRAAGDAE